MLEIHLKWRRYHNIINIFIWPTNMTLIVSLFCTKFLSKLYHNNVFVNCKFSFDFSPSGTALRKIEQIKDYLLRHGTCKCGLPCPLRPDYFFEFNPQVSLIFTITCKFIEWLIEKSSFIENAKTALDYHHLSFAHSILILRITKETGTPLIKLNSV